MNVDNLASIVAIVVAVGSLVINWRRADPQNRMDNTGADKNIAEGAAQVSEGARVNAETALQLNNRLVARVSALEADLAEACEKLTKIQDHVQAIEAENFLLRNWAERLVHQVISLGGTPVQMGKALTQHEEAQPTKKKGKPDDA